MTPSSDEVRDVLSFAAFGVALVASGAYLWRARGLRRDPSPAAVAARRRQLRWLAGVAVAMFALAALL